MFTTPRLVAIALCAALNFAIGNIVYLVKLPSNGSQMLYATYLGGSAGEDVETHELAVDALGQAVVANGWRKDGDHPG